MREIHTRIPGVTVRIEGLASAAHRAEARRIRFGAKFEERLKLAKTVFDSSVQGLPTPTTPIHMIDRSVRFNNGAARELAKAQSDLDSLGTVGLRRTVVFRGHPIFPLPELVGAQHIAHRVIQPRPVLRSA